jgi:hypothetical protein
MVPDLLCSSGNRLISHPEKPFKDHEITRQKYSPLLFIDPDSCLLMPADRSGFVHFSCNYA